MRLITLLCCAALAAVLPAPAGQWDKATTVTFTKPVEMPGFVLPAGTYLFKLADVPSSRHVIQVFSTDEKHLYGTVLALPNLRLTATSDTVLRFAERPQNAPEAVRAWFYPGDTWGHEFVYPKVRAQQLAQSTHQIVLGGEVTPTETPAEMTAAPVVGMTPEKKEVNVEQEVQAPSPQLLAQVKSAPAAAEPPAPELPKTASPVPLVGLIGLASLFIAVALTAVRKRIVRTEQAIRR
jgi:hypothetical protein